MFGGFSLSDPLQGAVTLQENLYWNPDGNPGWKEVSWKPFVGNPVRSVTVLNGSRR